MSSMLEGFLDNLTLGSLYARPHTIDWHKQYEDDGADTDYVQYWEHFRVEEQGFIACNGRVVAIVGEEDNWLYEEDDYEKYLEDGGTMTEEEFDAAFQDIEPYLSGSEGPMMNYWYDAPSVSGGPAQAAAQLKDLPLCVVQVGEEYGLALTGGGMDLTWEIVDAYTSLGQLPPLHFTDLPAMAGRGASRPEDRVLIAACRRSLEVGIRHLERRLKALDSLAD